MVYGGGRKTEPAGGRSRRPSAWLETVSDESTVKSIFDVAKAAGEDQVLSAAGAFNGVLEGVAAGDGKIPPVLALQLKLIQTDAELVTRGLGRVEALEADQKAYEQAVESVIGKG